MIKYFCAAIVALSLCVSTSPADFAFSYGGHSYSVITTAATWVDAAADAAGQNGYLAEINDAGENAEISSQLQANLSLSDIQNTVASDGGGASYVWIGATDRAIEGTWIWDGDNNTAGSPIGIGQGANGGNDWLSAPGVYNNWGSGYYTGGAQAEPDDFNSDQDAAGIALTEWPAGSDMGAGGGLGNPGQWNDVSEANHLFYVVEFNGMIPEPGVTLLLLLGGLGLWRFKR